MLLLLALSSTASIDLDRTIREPFQQDGRRCERLKLYFDTGARFGEGVMCERPGKNRARTFWGQRGVATFWHPSGRVLAKLTGIEPVGLVRGKYWSSTGELIAERAEDGWKLGRKMRGGCRAKERVDVRGPNLFGAFPKFIVELAPPFTLRCGERVDRMLGPDGARLVDPPAAFHGMPSMFPMRGRFE